MTENTFKPSNLVHNDSKEVIDARNSNVMPIYGNQMVTPVVQPDYKRFGVSPLSENQDVAAFIPFDPMQVALENAHLNKQDSLVDIKTKSKITNWFTQQINRYGEDYLSTRVTAEIVSRNAERIIDDILFDRIDYSKQGSLLLIPVIIETLISYCANKVAYTNAVLTSLLYINSDYNNRSSFASTDPQRYTLMNGITDVRLRDISNAIGIAQNDSNVYGTLLNGLNHIRITKNPISLGILSKELGTSRNKQKKKY